MMHYTYEQLRAGLALIPALRSMGQRGPDPLPVEYVLSVDHCSSQRVFSGADRMRGQAKTSLKIR
jgi:hypothetical protein